MTRLSSTSLKALLFIACSTLYSGAVSAAVPAIWEAQLGATVTDAAADPTLDDQDDADTGTFLTFDSMSFPFPDPLGPLPVRTYTGADVLSISSNGTISLGGSNGSPATGSGPTLTAATNAIIAPFWTDLDPGAGGGGDIFIKRFNDDADADIDRIVITFATGHDACANEDCAILAQVQLLENGTIIFGYNGIDLDNSPGAAIATDLLIGVSPADGVFNPGSTDLSAMLPLFNSGAEPTIYELFSPAPGFDLDGTNIVFTPNLANGFAVSDSMLSPPVSTEPSDWETRIGTTIDGQALDNVDNDTASFSFGTMMFPFAGTTYTDPAIFNISSNGFISLGGNNGSDPAPSAAVLTGDVFPRLAPFWTNLDPGAQGGDIFINRITDDDADAAIDRIVITFALGHNQCDADECSVLAQVQLVEDGTVIFGYNGVDLVNALNDVSVDLLVGLSPGIGATDLGSTNISSTAPFNGGVGEAIYELFEAASAPPFDLDGGNVIFTPDGGGGFDVTAPGVSGSGIGSVPGRNSNQHHCSLGNKDAPLDPTLWLLVLVSLIYLGRRRSHIISGNGQDLRRAGNSLNRSPRRTLETQKDPCPCSPPHP